MYYVPLHRMTWMYHKIREKEKKKIIISNMFIYLRNSENLYTYLLW